ncbi:SPOR domain-containing protein [Marinobacteraceae bacterium S3BR75-40.1]
MQTIALSKNDILKLVAVIGLAPMAIAVLGFTITVALLSTNTQPATSAEISIPPAIESDNVVETEASPNETLVVTDEIQETPADALKPDSETASLQKTALAAPKDEVEQAVDETPAKPAPVPQTADTKGFTVQLGFFNNPGNARARADQLQSQGIPAKTADLHVSHGPDGTALITGHFKTRDEAEREKGRLHDERHLAGWVQPLARYVGPPLMAMQ